MSPLRRVTPRQSPSFFCNADLRLTERGRELGLVDDARWQRLCEKRDALERERDRLSAARVVPIV